jgi:hypothetical protein
MMNEDESISSGPNPPRLPIPPVPNMPTAAAPSIPPTTTSDISFGELDEQFDASGGVNANPQGHGHAQGQAQGGGLPLARHTHRKGLKSLWGGYTDISGKGKWSVSSYKFGFGPECLRDDDPETFWHSDGPQPHYITVEFPGKIAIQKLAIYLNFLKDDSYTPSVLNIRAGPSINDLQDVRVVALDKPEGWVTFDVSTEPVDDELDEGEGGEEGEGGL